MNKLLLETITELRNLIQNEGTQGYETTEIETEEDEVECIAKFEASIPCHTKSIIYVGGFWWEDEITYEVESYKGSISSKDITKVKEKVYELMA